MKNINTCKKSKTGKRFIFVVLAFAFLFLCFVIYNSFSIFVIMSNSMLPTLKSKSSVFESDWIIVENLSVLFTSPERGEIIVFEKNNEQQEQIQIIKRIAGLGGEEIEIETGILLVNGEQTSEISKTIQKKYENGGVFQQNCKLKIKPHSYMVLGDNSHYSEDSRYYGSINEDSIQGVAIGVIWPPWRIGKL